MILSVDKGMYQAALLSEKELTSRLNLPAHIAVGKVWAIVPKRGLSAWWFDPAGKVVLSMGDWLRQQTPERIKAMKAEGFWTVERYFKAKGFVQARIRIDGFWQTPLQRMTELEALQEGVNSVEEYSKLWDRINNKKGGHWADNPDVWRIKFSLPLDVCQAVSRVGRQAILDAAELLVLEKVS